MSPTDLQKGNASAARGAIWVLAADAGRVRFFSAEHSDGKLVEFLDLLNPDMRMREGDATSTPKGHVMQGAGGSGQTFEPHHTQSEHSAESFAKEVCERLETARQEGSVARIYVISEPSFLGLIRKNISPATKPLIVQETPRDLSRHPAAEIRTMLPKWL